MDYITPKKSIVKKCVENIRIRNKLSPTDPFCEPDVNSVAIFSREQWNQLNNRMHIDELQADELKKRHEAKEHLKKLSENMYKDWTNTYLGARAKKLKDRETRLAKEESERVNIDIKEANFQEEERRKKLCAARTQQYFETDRLLRFHSCLKQSEVLKEIELQLKLKQMQNEKNKSKGNKDHEEFRRKLDEAIKKEQNEAIERKIKAKDTANFLKSQIEYHAKCNAMEKEAAIKEGEEIRKLAMEAAEMQNNNGKHKREEMNKLKEILLSSISDHKKWQIVNQIRDEEFDEKNRIYAAAKRKMTFMRIEKEKALHASKQVMQNQAVRLLEEQLSLLHSNENQIMDNAVKTKEAELEAYEQEKLAKQRKGIQGVLDYRNEVIKAKAMQKIIDDKEAAEDLKRRIKAAEDMTKENLEHRAKKLAEGMELANINLKKMVEDKAQAKAERQAEIEFYSQGDKDVQMEEEMFQDYAKRVIESCEKSGRNIYAMRKMAGKEIGHGLGMNLPGKGCIRTSAADLDPKCKVLPDLKPDRIQLQL